MFFQYYVVFVLIFGSLIYFACSRLIKSRAINIMLISIAHVMFVTLLINELIHLDSGSFFERAP